MVLKACKVCSFLTEEKKCPICGSDELSVKWKGLVIIAAPEKSETAKKLGITKPGRYALSVA
ncbi:MAG: DNA-directed RNA polymerase, subunit E'' [Candidatus Parvarchaeota archaeon]|jgi:DNA-directed RNA polymerase subunit E"|nr:DNA-directed RNA polymerase, subunit E'' [Candidatus Parvarchaeota archaeon]MCL5101144.1 DNA-directed RNA polymerase, subunit E'' [Candidatus Parvarchaeota archaeon]